MHIELRSEIFKNLHFMDLVSRLKQYLDSRQISITQFADECSIPRPTGSQLLAGRNKKVSDEIIGKIHAAYPELSIVWLMFGEGNMVTGANIEISEPQKQDNADDGTAYNSDSQAYAGRESYIDPISENQPEKFHEINESSYGYHDELTDTPPCATSVNETSAGNTFSFSPNPPTSQIEAKVSPTATDTEKDSITVTPGKGKRVTGIVVYYDDSTYESFIPDPTHRHPFMR